MSGVSVVGVPSSAGSYAAGQDQAPEALRAAGLIDALTAAGLDVNDDGDLPKQIWKPDRAHPFAQNLNQVKACLHVLDFTDAPLAENTDGRNSGLTLDQLGEALGVAAQDPRFRVLSIGELNPTRSAGDPDEIARFVRVLAATLGAKAGR
jgi:arginase family enzyme